MSGEQVREILKDRYDIDSVIEGHGVLMCLIDISADNILTLQTIFKELGYNKSWGLRPKGSKQSDAITFDEVSREKHYL